MVKRVSIPSGFESFFSNNSTPQKIHKGFGMSLGSRTGEKALAFTLNDEDGREIRLDDFSGNWLLMVFHRHLA